MRFVHGLVGGLVELEHTQENAQILRVALAPARGTLGEIRLEEGLPRLACPRACIDALIQFNVGRCVVDAAQDPRDVPAGRIDLHALRHGAQRLALEVEKHPTLAR